MNQGLKIALIGLFFGMIAAILLTGAMATLLFGVNPVDLATFTIISFLIVLVVCIACYFPARKAARLNPLTALRHE